MIFRAPKGRRARVIAAAAVCVIGGALVVGLLRRGRVSVPPPPGAALVPSDADLIAAARRDLPEKVTFNRDVAPVVFANCSRCHRPGEAAPFSLLSYGDVKRRASQMAELTARRVMPPWLPEPGHGQFAGERRLTPRQIALIGKWAEQGAPEGDPADLPPAPRFTEGWQLGEPDLVVEMPEPYLLAADGPDVYRNFVVPVNLPASRWVRAVEFRPGNPKVVHHAFVLVDPGSDSGRKDAEDPQVGFGGMSAGETAVSPDGHFLSWQPGAMPSDSAGAASRPATGQASRLVSSGAWRLRKGSDLVLQTHLRPSGKPETLRARVGLYFTDEPRDRQPLRLLLRSVTIDIPPGAKDYVIEDRYTLPVPVQVLAVLPHAHYLGKEMKAWATLPNGTTVPLIWIRNWDFNWQGDYRYAAPIELPRRTVISMRYVYDNSEQNPRNPTHPPRRVTYGLQTSDEMGELWLQVLTRDTLDRQTLESDYVHTWSVRDALARNDARLRADPTDAAARTDRARVLGVAGRTDEAMQELRLALTHNPRYARAHYWLGTLHQSRRELFDAKSRFVEALRQDPDDYRAHNNLGLLLLGEHDLVGAAQHFNTVLRLNPSDVNARINLGLIAYQQGDYPKAVGFFEEAISYDPDDAAARGNLAKTRAMLTREGPRSP